jgi:outer membrane protein TolC
MLIIGSLSAISQRVFTLDDCIQIALKENLAIQSSENEIQLAKLAHEENGKTIFPQIKVEAKALHAPDPKNFGYDPAITDGGQYSAQLVVQESLFDGGARSTKSNQLQIDIQRTQAERRKNERDLQYDVTIAFLNVLQASEELNLEQKRVSELSNYLELVKSLSLGGGTNYTDLLKTEVSFENAKIAHHKSNQSYLDAKYSLMETMGIPGDTAFSISGTLEIPDSIAIDSLTRELAVDSLHSIDLSIANFNIQKSLLDVDLARSERYPTISLSGDFGILTSGDNLRLPVDQKESVIGYSIGISVENLLFNWGMTDLRIQQQQLAAQNLRLSYNRQQRALQTDITRLRNQLKSTSDQLYLIDQIIKKAEDNYILTKAQYTGGATTALEVLSAEQLLSENRQADIQTRTDFKRLIAKIEQLTK